MFIRDNDTIHNSVFFPSHPVKSWLSKKQTNKKPTGIFSKPHSMIQMYRKETI